MKILYVCNNYTLVESLYDRVSKVDNEYIFICEPPFIEDTKIIYGLIDNNPFSIWNFIIQNNGIKKIIDVPLLSVLYSYIL